MRREVALALAVAGAVAACSGGGGSASPGATTSSTIRRTPAADVPLHVGDCGDVERIRPGVPIDPASITIVPCTQPHSLEVAAVFDYPASQAIAFPGTASVDGYAIDECLARFEPYVGVPYADADLDVTIVAPDAAGWAEGDRRVACLVYDVDFTPLTTRIGDG